MTKIIKLLCCSDKGDVYITLAIYVMGNSMISFVTLNGTFYTINGCHLKMHEYFHFILVVSVPLD